MNDWNVKISNALLLTSFVAFVIGIFTQGKLSFHAFLTGYVVASIVLLFMLVLFCIPFLNSSANAFTIFKHLFPFVLLLSIVAFSIYMMIAFQQKILANNVTANYRTFSTIVVLLSFVQFYIIYGMLNKPSTQKPLKVNMPLNSLQSSILLLLGVLTSISAIIEYINLAFYSTDG